MLPMFSSMTLIFALSAGTVGTLAASPPPTPAPPLKFIVRMRATNLCAKIAAHANGAIDSALLGDRNVVQAQATLRAVDLTSNGLTRTQGLHSLEDVGAAIANGVRGGGNEVTILRALIAKEQDPVAKKQLLDFTNALGGAIYRQKRMGRDLDGFVARLYAQSMYHVSESEEQMAIYVLHRRTLTPLQGTGALSIDSAPDRLGLDPVTRPMIGMDDRASALDIAHDFQRREALVTNDEATAAQAVLTISKRC